VLEAETAGAEPPAESTLPGFAHDVCSPIHPLAVASPLLSPSTGSTCIRPCHRLILCGTGALRSERWLADTAEWLRGDA
jgi:hypothetical protein